MLFLVEISGVLPSEISPSKNSRFQLSLEKKIKSKTQFLANLSHFVIKVADSANFLLHFFSHSDKIPKTTQIAKQRFGFKSSTSKNFCFYFGSKRHLSTRKFVSALKARESKLFLKVVDKDVSLTF